MPIEHDEKGRFTSSQAHSLTKKAYEVGRDPKASHEDRVKAHEEAAEAHHQQVYKSSQEVSQVARGRHGDLARKHKKLADHYRGGRKLKGFTQSNAGLPNFGKKMSVAMGITVEKEVIRPGTYWYRDESSGAPRKLVVTPELTKYWNEQGNAMLSAGLTVPVPFEHDFDAHPMTPADKLKNNAGWVSKYHLSDGKGGAGDRLFSTIDVQDAGVAAKLPGTIRWTSPWINSFTDGQGKEWKNVISHLALTTRPRIVDQAPFGSVAAALSMATPIKGWGDVSDRGVCLSNAGLLAASGLPEYPIAFSAWSDGVALNTEHDAATGQFTVSGQSGAAKPRKNPNRLKKVGAGHLISKAEKHAASGRHDQASIHYMAAAHHYRSQGSVAAADSMDTLAKEHAEKHFGKAMSLEETREKLGAAMATDFPPQKGKPKPKPGKPDAPPLEGVDDDGDGDGDGDEVPDDGDPSNDDNIDLEPFGDPAGDVSMTELLCDLLGALGIQIESSGDEAAFKRDLYNAVMTEIHNLTGKAKAGEEQDKKNRTNPPGQPPNNKQPGQPGQPNPLIQQEQQPMFMSLEDIHKLADPTMKQVALSMYAENQKLRAEVDAGAKTANSLRDAKLKEEAAKRTSRVQLLGRLSPRVKADLDAMLALPAMALSMGDGGAVVDPMAQTLAVLEKGLADMPRLLMTDQSALSVQPQPQDADMLTEERSDEIADSQARKMGCPPVAKAS